MIFNCTCSYAVCWHIVRSKRAHLTCTCIAISDARHMREYPSNSGTEYSAPENAHPCVPENFQRPPPRTFLLSLTLPRLSGLGCLCITAYVLLRSCCICATVNACIPVAHQQHQEGAKGMYVYVFACALLACRFARKPLRAFTFTRRDEWQQIAGARPTMYKLSAQHNHTYRAYTTAE